MTKQFETWEEYVRSEEYRQQTLEAMRANCKIIEIDGLSYFRTKGGRYERDGVFYRFRRGRLIEIPSGWVGRVTSPQTIARRSSKKGQGRRFRRKVQRKKGQ